MTARRVAGITAISSGLLVIVLLVVGALSGASTLGAAPGYSGTVPWMIGGGGMGPWMMGGGGRMGPGMMGFGASGPASTAIPGATEVRVQAANFSFTPSEVPLPKGTDVNLTLVNPSATGVVHDLTVPALGIHVVANAGETRTIGLRGLAAGRYDAYCSVPGHAEAGMRAVIVVE